MIFTETSLLSIWTSVIGAEEIQVRRHEEFPKKLELWEY